ncbi:MAG: hypothetical protein AB1449_12885 [Chloroflexota bacterium]
MDRKTGGIIATLAATLFCGCPGLFACLFGALTAAGFGTWTGSLGLEQYSDNIPSGYGIGLICLGLLFVLIPILVGFLTLRRKPQPTVEDIPPAA